MYLRVSCLVFDIIYYAKLLRHSERRHPDYQEWYQHIPGVPNYVFISKCRKLKIKRLVFVIVSYVIAHFSLS